MSRSSILVWFRDDLRLADHAPLSSACAEEADVVPVYLHTPDDVGAWPRGAASRSYRHHALAALIERFDEEGSRLVLRRGEACLDLLRELIEETNATALYFHRAYTPGMRSRDADLIDALETDDLTVRVFEGRLLHDPEAVETTSGTPYQVYTPFWRRFREEVEIGMPLDVPAVGEHAPASWPESAALDDLGLLPEVDWDASFYEVWTAGEQAAHDRLQTFLDDALEEYADLRNRPDLPGTSRLSPSLHHGTLSPRQIWHAVLNATGGAVSGDAEVYLKELVWREFSYHVLYHHPATPTEPLKEKFAAYTWRTAEADLEAWQRGRTGYPIVDAGMRQLWETGWMHNRVRMIAASFLTKDLGIDWREGARWFWDTLIDADLANNTMGWQWSAGTGADAQPFFRIFNPVSQGRKHDPEGDYVRRWVPELADLPTRHLHAPWEAPEDVLEEAGVELGETYPAPIVDHAEARDRALAEYEKVK